MIKLKVSYETETERDRIVTALSRGNTIKKITKPIKSYSKGKELYRFYMYINQGELYMKRVILKIKKRKGSNGKLIKSSNILNKVVTD